MKLTTFYEFGCSKWWPFDLPVPSGTEMMSIAPPSMDASLQSVKSAKSLELQWRHKAALKPVQQVASYAPAIAANEPFSPTLVRFPLDGWRRSCRFEYAHTSVLSAKFQEETDESGVAEVVCGSFVGMGGATALDLSRQSAGADY
jgi:hypothetical protein